MSEEYVWSDDDEWGDELQWTPHASTNMGHPGQGDETASPPVSTGAQHVILLVDCHSDMFGGGSGAAAPTPTSYTSTATATHSSSDVTPIHLALQLCQQLLQELLQDTVKLKVGKRNGVGVVLYDTKPMSAAGTPKENQRASNHNEEDVDHNYDDDDDDGDDDENENENDDDDPATPRHVHVLMDLNPPGIKQVQTIRACLKGDRNVREEFSNATDGTTGGRSSSTRVLPLQTAMEEALRLFRHAKCVRNKQDSKSKNKEAMDTKSIWIFTNRSHPFATNNDGGSGDSSTAGGSSLGHRQSRDLDDARKRMASVANDCRENGIQIILWPLFSFQTSDAKTQPADKGDPYSFDMHTFYQDIISQDVFHGRRLHNIDDLWQGLDLLQSYWKKIRRLYWGPLLLPGQSVSAAMPSHAEEDDDQDHHSHLIMVDWFRFVQLAKKPNKVQIDQYTKRETIKLKQYLDHNHEIIATIPLGPTAKSDRKPQPGLGRLRQFATFGGEDVPMSGEDMNRIRVLSNGFPLSGSTSMSHHLEKPGLRLLGFKPLHAIPWYHSMNPAYLIYPNDTVIKGSLASFTELRQAMIRKQVVGIGEVLHRIHWSSRLVALYPLADHNDEEGNGEPPPEGIMVVTLPFEDDIRTLEEDEAYQEWRNRQSQNYEEQFSSSITKMEADAPDEIPSDTINPAHTTFPSSDLVQAAVNLISRHGLVDMKLGEDFDNAALTEFYTYLEQVALELPVDDGDLMASSTTVFDTRPDESRLVQILGRCIDDFRDQLPDDLELPKKGTAVRGGSLKRKNEVLCPDDSGIDWNDLYLSEELHTVTIPQLKSYLRSVGAPLSGNKTLLVNRVSNLIEASIAKARSSDTTVKLER